jgi:hypothetical protein
MDLPRVLASIFRHLDCFGRIRFNLTQSRSDLMSRMRLFPKADSSLVCLRVARARADDSFPIRENVLAMSRKLSRRKPSCECCYSYLVTRYCLCWDDLIREKEASDCQS